MPLELPDVVMQRLGLMPPPAPMPSMPPPVDDSMPSMPPPVDDSMAGVPPGMPQGAAPPPPPQAPSPEAPPGPPPIDQGAPLPSMRDHQPAPAGAPPSNDYQVPLASVMPPAPPPPVKPAPAPHMPAPDQQMAQAHSQQQAADQASLGAINSQTAVDRAKAQDELASYQKYNDQFEAAETQRKAFNDERDKTLASKQTYIDNANKQLDNYKVDQDKYWKEAGVGTHVGWFIAMALTGIGDALSGKGGQPNAVIAMLQNKIHQNVQAQMDQRDQLKDKIGRAEHAYDRYDAFSKDKNAQINLIESGYDRMLANKIALTTAKTADPQAIARGQGLVAQLMESSAEKANKAAEFATTNDIAKKQLGISQQQVGIAGGHLALAQKQFDWTKNKDQQELDLKAAELMRKSEKDQKDKVASNGIFNPVTGNPLLTAKGKEMVAKADQLEAQARQNPEQAPQMAQQAKQLRDAANAGEVATIDDKEDRRKITDTLAHAQDVVDMTSKIKEFLRNDPGITDREGWAKLKTQYGTMTADYIKSLGANATSREFQAITDHVLKYDPDSWTDRLIGKKPAAASLDGLDEAVRSGVNSLLKSKGIKDGWTPTAAGDSQAATFGGKTAAELGRDVTPANAADTGVKYDPSLTWVQNVIRNPALGSQVDENDAFNSAVGRTGPADNAGNPGKPSEYGLDPNNERMAHELVQRAESSGDAKRNQIIEQIVAPIATNNRPSLSIGLLNLVRDQDPGMYKDILVRLDDLNPAQAKQIREIEAMRGSMTASAPNLANLPVPPPADASPQALRAWQQKLVESRR